MKKTDIAMIILIAAIGVGIGYAVASNISFFEVPKEGTKVKTIEEITADVETPSEAIFNSNAINPTVEVFVGQSTAN